MQLTYRSSGKQSVCSVERSRSIIATQALDAAMDMNVYLLGKLNELQQISEQEQASLYYNQIPDLNTQTRNHHNEAKIQNR
jgi:hypothetical protein